MPNAKCQMQIIMKTINTGYPVNLFMLQGVVYQVKGITFFKMDQNKKTAPLQRQFRFFIDSYLFF
jgi:hypothetical protein